VLRSVLIQFLYFALAALLGTLYAGLVGLVTYPLRASLISWPVWIGLFWIVLWRFKLVCYAGYFAVLPLSILSFEFVRTITHPPIYAFQYMSLDRGIIRQRPMLRMAATPYRRMGRVRKAMSPQFT